MAQLVFDPVTGGITTIDSQAVLAVQSFLDADGTITTETVPTLDDEDVFQCGKCKKQFTSLNSFMNHKKERCLPADSSSAQETQTFIPSVSIPSTSDPSGSANVLMVKNIEPTKGPNYAVASAANKHAASFGNLVLSETDLLSLALEGTNTLTSSVQTPVMDPASLVQPTTGNRHQDHIEIHNLADHSSAGGIELSLLSSGVLSSSGSLLLASQPGAAGTTNFVLTIANPSVLKKDEPLGEVTSSSASKVETAVQTVLLEAFQNGATKPKKTSKGITKINPPCPGSKGTASEGAGSKRAPREHTQNEKLKCKYCDKRFSKNFDLEQHMRCHTGEKPFQCIICGRAFAQKSNVKKHIETHRVWPDGLCSTLPAGTLTAVDNKKADNGQHATDLDDTGESVTDVEAMLCSPSIDNSYVCPYCQCSYKTYAELKGHMKEHKNEKVFKCILASCAKMFEDLDVYLDHVKSHEKEITYHCHMCTKVFQSLYDLGLHQYSHNPSNKSPRFKKTFQCSSCLNKYATAAALEHHMATSPHNYPCPHCEKKFPCERYLRRHLPIHSSRRSGVICPICSKSFKGEHYLRVHSLIHTGEKPFTCPQCDTSFNRTDKLKRHLLIHEPMKRFKCPFRKHSGCLKEFSRPDKLKAHILTHGKTKKAFFCRACGRSFIRKTQFKAHQAQHEEEKSYPFQCTKCASGFLNQEVYDSHVCIKFQSLRRRMEIPYKRSTRSRKSKYNRLHHHKKLSKPVHEEDTVLVDDGIPTAHIEIISTTGDLVQVSELSQISLQLHQLVEAAKNDSGQNTVIQKLPLVPIDYDLQEVISVQPTSSSDAENKGLVVENDIIID